MTGHTEDALVLMEQAARFLGRPEPPQDREPEPNRADPPISVSPAIGAAGRRARGVVDPLQNGPAGVTLSSSTAGRYRWTDRVGPAEEP